MRVTKEKVSFLHRSETTRNCHADAPLAAQRVHDDRKEGNLGAQFARYGTADGNFAAKPRVKASEEWRVAPGSLVCSPLLW